MANFEISSEDIDRLQQAIMNYGNEAEQTINETLNNEAKQVFTNSITNLIPVSNRNKQHARNANPVKGEQKENLSLYLHTPGKWHYLYFPDEAAGSKFAGKAPYDFMTKGVEAESDNVINKILDKLQNNFK